MTLPVLRMGQHTSAHWAALDLPSTAAVCPAEEKDAGLALPLKAALLMCPWCPGQGSKSRPDQLTATLVSSQPFQRFYFFHG